MPKMVRERLHLPEVGEVVVARVVGAKRMKLWLDGQGVLRMSVPWATPKLLWPSLVAPHHQWVARQRQVLAERPAPVVGERTELLDRAKQALPPRLAELAGMHGLHYSKVLVRFLRTRWGSCSTSGTISLSANLLLLPAELCDYVLLHELAHTVHHHHQPAFWQFLDGLCGQGVGGAKRLQAQLRTYQRQHLLQ